jgi:hypothetical protein
MSLISTAFLILPMTKVKATRPLDRAQSSLGGLRPLLLVSFLIGEVMSIRFNESPMSRRSLKKSPLRENLVSYFN